MSDDPCEDRAEAERGDAMDDREAGRHVFALDAINGDDPEVAHVRADQVLLEAVHPDVRDAYLRVAERADWWAFA